MGKVTFRDQVLAKFAAMPKATASEVAIKGLMVMGTQVASVSKRAHDLSRRDVGFLIETGKRECVESGHDAMTFKISQSGIEYLQSKGIGYRLAGEVTPPAAKQEQPPSKSTGRSALSGLRSSLGA